ncbi:RNA methyltransferase [Metarhizobium album]|uniref:RNA methyltransferase n=1 Tax=Metarhizobium album TaxID=2182425 RepID=A0A2U2DUS9_9HYPH|nr:RNA methyltransferase [Rhizobium album]PWE57075.1 RNA methyltransferase [Rhizobium album]
MGTLIPIDDADDPRIAEFRDIRERDLTGRQGRFIAEGTVVLRMLAAAHAAGRGVAAEKLLLLKNRVAGISDLLEVLPPDVPVHVAERDVLNAIVGFDLHRGVLALGRRLEVSPVDAFVATLPAEALVVVGCNISNHDNIGAIFRNAAAFGADAVLLDETCCDPLYRKSLRVSVGSVLSVPFRREGSALQLLTALAERNFSVWALSPNGATDIRAVQPSARTALVLGTEGEGLPAEILGRFHSARVPQMAGLDSLNVATATGIALYQIASAMKRV